MFRNAIRSSNATAARFAGQVRTYADAPAGSIGAAGDAFSKREKASEDKYFKEREQERNTRLRKHIKDQRTALDELEASIGKDDNPQVGKV